MRDTKCFVYIFHPSQNCIRNIILCYLNQGGKSFQIIHRMISNYRIIWRLKRPQLNLSIAVAITSCLLVTVESLGPFTLYCILINGLVIKAFYCTRRGFICCFENLKCLVGNPLRPTRRESTLNTLLSVSNWVCRHSSVSSETVLRNKALLCQTNTFCVILNYFPMGSLFLGLIYSVIIIKHKLLQALKQRRVTGS
jgi:hypothetical protein